MGWECHGDETPVRLSQKTNECKIDEWYVVILRLLDKSQPIVSQERFVTFLCSDATYHPLRFTVSQVEGREDLCICIQRNDWSQHKRECAGLRKINPGRPTDTMRLVMRLLNMAAATPAVKQQLDFLMTSERKGLRVQYVVVYYSCLVVLFTDEDKMSEEVRAEMAMQVMGVCMLLGDKGEEGRDLHDRQEIFGILGKVGTSCLCVRVCVCWTTPCGYNCA